MPISYTLNDKLIFKSYCVVFSVKNRLIEFTSNKYAERYFTDRIFLYACLFPMSLQNVER